MDLPQPSQAFAAAVEEGLNACGWDRSRPLVVAFSGGADSTALLLACATLASQSGAVVCAAHFDHRIRDDSAKDREYIDLLAHQLGVQVIAGVGDVPEFARERSMSIETAARELRYRFLADAVDEAGAQGVVTGHTIDDQAETVLMNVLRGSGTRGLSGMRHRTTRPAGRDWPAVTVLRPMLGLRHSDCKAACQDAGVDWLEDPSNRETRHMRNRVRHQLLPLAEQIRDGAVSALARLATNVAEAESLLHELAASQAPIHVERGIATVNRAALRSLHAALQSHALASMYEVATGGMEGIEQDHIVAMRDLADGGSGTELSLPGGYVFRVEYETCSIGAAASEADDWLPGHVPELELPVPGQVNLPGGFTLTASTTEAPGNPGAFGSNVAHISSSAVSGPLRVRARRDGDRFHPLGMKTEMRLQDFLVNAHIPERLRDRVPLVESGGRIAWVACQRIAEWAKLDETADKAIRLELMGFGTGAGGS